MSAESGSEPPPRSGGPPSPIGERQREDGPPRSTQHDDGRSTPRGAAGRAPTQHSLPSSQHSALSIRLRGWLAALRETFYGMTGYEFAQHARHLRAERETLLLALTFGDIIGLPVLPPYYSLRLLPYAVPELERWKRRVLRERHSLDNEEFDLIEM